MDGVCRCDCAACVYPLHSFFFSPSVGVGMPGLHVCVCVFVLMCVYVCRFPDVFHLEIKQASPLTPALSLKSLIGPQSLEHSSLSMIVLLFSSLGCFHSTLWLCRLAGRQAGGKAPAHLLYWPPGTLLWAKSVQNVKHRWPLTHKWVHGK